MAAWNNRNFPYPVLSPVSDDYQPGIEFRADMPGAAESNGKEITLQISYQNTSDTLGRLIGDGQARYCLLIECVATKRRDTCTGAEPRQTHKLPAAEYSRSFTATPFITAVKPIAGFTSDEHNEEYAEIKPEGFDIPVGAILAVSDYHEINLLPAGSPYSIIDIVTDDSIAKGQPHVVDTDHDRIRIRIGREHKGQVEAIRQHRHNPQHPHMRGLFSSLYMPGIATAISRLPESSNAWAYSLRQMLKGKKIDVEDAANDPVYYAQILMDDPVGQFIQTFANEDE